MKEIRISTSKDHVNWKRVVEILERQGLCHNISVENMKLMFCRSYAVAFAYDGDKMIGVGRALSDGISQAAIYNIALDNEYHGNQIGRKIIDSLIAQVPGCIVVLYTHPKTVALYEHLGFRRCKTAMAYVEEGESMDFWDENGFLLPEHYRFHDNKYEQIPYHPETKIPLD